MKDKEFNKDFWIIYEDQLIGRLPVGINMLKCLIGTEKTEKIKQLAGQNKNQILIVRPFHHVKIIIYRH